MKTRHINISIIFIAFIFIGFVGQVLGEETAVVTTGYEPHEADLFGVRFRSFANTGGGEMYTGLANFGGGPNRVEADLNWTEENKVTFTFDADADKLIASVTNSQGTTTIEYLNLSETLAKKDYAYTTADLNVMQITLANRDKESLAIFSDVEVNGQELGTFSEMGWHDWMVTGIDFSQGFTITGTIQLSGAFSNSQEKSKVEIKVGYSSDAVPTATDTPEPTATNTPEPTATDTPEPTATDTPEPTATDTPQPTATNTSEPTGSDTSGPIPTNTHEPTATNTPEPTATNTTEPTATNTPEPTATNTPEPTATSTSEPTATNTPEPVVTIVPGPAMTTTPQPPSLPTDSIESPAHQLFLPFIKGS